MNFEETELKVLLSCLLISKDIINKLPQRKKGKEIRLLYSDIIKLQDKISSVV